MKNISDLTCPLCEYPETPQLVKGGSPRVVFNCERCDLHFVPAAFHISIAEEKERYERHQNSLENVGYREFLSRLVSPLYRHLRPGMKGLDYGCGPSQSLSLLMAEQGFVVDSYDPIFQPELDTCRKYDFVTATEVFEHFRTPGPEIPKLLARLTYGGILGVMTQEAPKNLENWYYLRDPTHVSFYSQKCMEWIALKFDLAIIDASPSVWIFEKMGLE